MDTLLLEACRASPRPTLLLDRLSGPVDCAFVLYRFLDAGAAAGAPCALIASAQAPPHHRAALRKALGPARGDGVALVCAWEVARRQRASAAGGGGGGAAAAAAALAGALLAAASGGAGAAAGLWLAVEDVQSLCEVAGGAAQGLAVLEALAAAAAPRALLVRAEGASDWLLDGGGSLVAPSLLGALEQWAGAVLTGRDVPSGFSRAAHGSLHLRRRAEGGGGAPELTALFRVGADGSARDPA
jgi:hypothetical protein